MAEPNRDFIREIVANDLASGKHEKVVTRFPPEPNGYLHIGHAKAICLNYDIAIENGGTYHLRFDDTNPIKEEQRFVDGMIEDIRWLGYDWGEHTYFASDYFGQFYEWAQQLIRKGLAYVDDLSADEIRESRGTLTEPGQDSPHRDRAVDENLDLFERMKKGEFPDGSKVLRAKIDMAAPNINLRDPVMYRIAHTEHHRTGDAWCIYPMYDWAHGQGDSIEGITHSLCSLEFENHRPLYDWFLSHLDDVHISRQFEFARLNISYTVTQKRILRQLVEDGHVSGWDDPRMPTLIGMRRRGFAPEAIRDFCQKVGVTKAASLTEMALLEHCLRDNLNRTSPRVMGVLEPLRLVIENYPDGETEEFEVINNPEDESAGTRRVPFSKVLYIERKDFMEDAPRKYFRLSPGREVRLRGAYFVTCTGSEKDADGNVTEVRCTYDPATRGGDAPDGRRVKGTLHWVSEGHAVDAEVRLYDTLFSVESPSDLATDLNPDSLVTITDAKVEPSVKGAAPLTRYQFERTGYFCVDPDSTAERPVFNRTVGLRDSWAKIRSR
ncbi:MAG: glutamine--tRNA ligase/YqeY domain fusion protein [Planctomycetota bacterium]|jgi:glutaminyl-tRNA synthetase